MVPGEREDGLKVHRMEKVCKGRIGNTVKCKAVQVRAQRNLLLA